jgi:hypothetical protein
VALEKLSSGTGASLGNLLVHVDALDGNHNTLIAKLHLNGRVADEAVTAGADKATRLGLSKAK